VLKEFREFISKGNMLDLAIGIVIGAAFTAIVNSLVADLITPLISLLGNSDFKNYVVVLKPGVVLRTGAFASAVINFLIVGFALFMIVKAANRMKRVQEAQAEAVPEPEIPNNEKLLMEIRDLLRQNA
jgi:large conductance mechanosensitive channel